MDNADELLRLLEGASVRALRRQNAISIAISGGLDSSILASLIAKHAEIPLQLVTASAPGSIDAHRARLMARHLALPLTEIVLTRATAGRLLRRVVAVLEPETIDPDRAQEWGLSPRERRISPIRAAVGIVLFACAEEAASVSRRMVVGQGADELFGGYARYARAPLSEVASMLERDWLALRETGLAQEARLAQAAGVQFTYPYLDPRVVAFAQRQPIELLAGGEERKPLLREVARRLGLPDEIAAAPKTAAQYGSGAGSLVAALAADAGGVPLNDFLTALHHRTSGEDHSLRT